MEPSPLVTLESERVALGPLRRDLVALYNKWDNDLELAALRGSNMRPTPDDTRDHWIDDVTKDPSSVFFTIYETVFEHKAPRPVGVSMLLKIDRFHGTAEFGMYLGERDSWNSGIGTEATRLMLDYAFNALGLGNVLLRVVATNARAVRAYEKAGFKAIGRQRGSYRVGHRRYDDLYMDCVASEFESPVLVKAWEKTLGG